MLHRLQNRMLLPLALAVALAACDSGSTPLAPEATTPSVVASASYQVVKGRDGAGTYVSEIVDRKGATLILAGHELRIAPLTVDQPTRFVMKLTGEDELRVELSATTVNSNVHNDVGRRGFTIPVQLVMSYASATDPVDVTALTIVYTHPDGTLYEMSSVVDAATQRVSARLYHFSGYAIADRTMDESADSTGP